MEEKRFMSKGKIKIKPKFIIIVSVLLALIIVATIFISSCQNAVKSSLAKEGDGENYEFLNLSSLTSRADYSYNSSNESYWDYYSMDFELDLYEFDYDITTSSTYVYSQYPYNGRYITTYGAELYDVSSISVSGYFAQSGGLYYLKEIFEDRCEEVIVDANTNDIAGKITGTNPYTYFSLSTNAWTDFGLKKYDEQFKDIGFDFSATVVENYLEITKHFFDIEILKYFNEGEENYTKNGNLYILNGEKATKENAFASWFGDYDSSTYFSWKNYEHEITSCSATIDLTNPATPKLNFSLTASFPKIESEITCGGTIKYNYVNNTKIEVPDEVTELWNGEQTNE